MKLRRMFFGLLILAAGAMSLHAQEEEVSNSGFAISTDLVSNYVWRGSRLGGPSLQPTMSFNSGGLTLGVWGSFDAAGYMEADPYISYSFPFGLSLGLTDYYFPSLKLFEISDSTGSHALEANVSLKKGGVRISGNYIFNTAGGVGSIGNDVYVEAGYSFAHMEIFMGAGNGWHTAHNDFTLCNLGIKAFREIKITETFSIPVTGQIICNPDREALFLVVGFTL
jgi:hypothetical protein